MNIKIHDIVPVTVANGPGKRFAIWVQGCDRNCPECFNPETHSFDGGILMEVDDLINTIFANREIEGISVSGGEPFLQPVPLAALFSKLKEQSPLSILVYSGYTLNELQQSEPSNLLLEYIDILVAGPYRAEQQIEQPLLSSANQKIHFLTSRYSIVDLDCADCEYIIHDDGTIIITGSNI